MTLLVMAPPIFGTLFDVKPKVADILARVLVIVGGILILIVVLVPSLTRFWFIGQVLVCLGTSPMHVFAYGASGGYENKIAAMCVYNFWFLLSQLFVYFNQFFWGDADSSTAAGKENFWPTYIMWYIFMIVSVIIGQKVLSSD